MTSLLLHYHERKWFHQIKKWDLQNACAFSNILHFLDGLCVFSHDRFKINYLYIYPNELEVKKKKMKMFAKLHCYTHQEKTMIKNFQLTSFIKEVALPFMLFTCPIWIVILHIKYCIFHLFQKFYILPGQQKITND